MTEFTRSLSLAGSGSLSAGAPSVVPSLSMGGSMVVSGLQVVQLASGIHHVQKYVGEPNVPADIKRQRRYTFELMRRVGTPVILKKMLTDRDANEGTAEPSPNFDPIYGQTRNEDPLSFGTGFVSTEKAEHEYLNAHGDIFYSKDDPGPEFPKAPRYRGFGPSFLTYIIEPDAATDFYKHTPEGIFVRVQDATALAPWWPAIGDNDLIIQVTTNVHRDLLSTNDRYQAKMVNPVSIRGLDRRGRREYDADTGNRFVINQTFNMSLIPRQNILMRVEVDR